jgi:hypothetical protein
MAMKCANALLAGMVIVLLSGCGQTAPPGEVRVREEAPTSVDRETATQNRINSVFYVALVQKLKDCWSGIGGKGDITFKYTYRADGTNWRWQQHEVESSTLTKDQDAIALKCMQDAARDSSFPMEAAEAAHRSPEFNLHWTWPVPFPQDVTALGRMIDTGRGGGEGCKKSCVDCDCPFKPGTGVVCSCAMTCSGYTSPCTVHSDAKGCNMQLPKCATGKLGGFGGVIIARTQ